jgi:hypothetical protein
MLDTTEQQQELLDGGTIRLSPEKAIEMQREIIQQSLHGIASEVGMLLRDSGLDFPVGFTVPSSGRALVNVVCMVDPPDSDWTQATEIVVAVLGKILGGQKLRTGLSRCAVARAPMSVAEVTADLDADT